MYILMYQMTDRLENQREEMGIKIHVVSFTSAAINDSGVYINAQQNQGKYIFLVMKIQRKCSTC